MRIGGYEIDILVQGYPGKSVGHGSLGWSTVALVRGGGDNNKRVALVDAGAFNIRRQLIERLGALGLNPRSVTDLLLTHAHWDHAVNWTALRRALELAQVRYDTGVSNYLEVLDAQRSLFDAELAASQAELQQVTSAVQLYKALGGSWRSGASAPR